MQNSIPDDIAEVIERLQEQEALDWEIKAARGGIPNSIWETVSAFANTQGGWLILGIAEREKSPVIEGVADPTSMVRQLHEMMRNSSKISVAICGAKDIQTLSVGEMKVVVVRVPRSPRRQRPVYTKGNPYTGTFVRRDEGDFPASRAEVDRMMREAADVAGDQVIPLGYSWDDIDRPTLQRYRQRFQTANPTSPHNDLNDEDFLGRLGGFRQDRETGQRGFTVAGILMFGTDDAIRTWRGRHLIDFRVVPGPASQLGQADWTDRFLWEGNLFGAYEHVYPRLTAGLPVPFALIDGVRQDQPDEHIALREAFVNLIVHADYSERDASLIFSSSQGFYFRNPGSSRVVDLDGSVGDRSDPRNPELVRMFRAIGLTEEAGSGVPRIRRVWRRLGYQAPLFDVGNDRYEFVVDLRLVHLLPEADRSWLDALDSFLSEDERLALIIALRQGEVDNSTLRGVAGLHPADSTRIPGGLRDRSLLQMIGGGRGARYQLHPTVVAHTMTHDQPMQAPLGLGESAVLNSADSALNSSDSETSTTDSILTIIVDDPYWLHLERIAFPISSTDYASATKMNEVVLLLCREKPLSLLDLVQLLGRNKAYIRTILKGLIDTGHLEYLYPDKPRRPDQRYRARQSPA